MPWKEVNIMDQRKKFVLESFKPGVNFSELCRDYGICTKTGYKWKTRFLEQGFEGLKDQTTIPRRNPKRLPEETVCEIIRIKKTKINWGPKKIRLVYAANHPGERIPSRSTIERILKKSGFVVERKRRRKCKSERIQNRIKPEKPNDIWTVDFKGWWYTPEKERCEPLTVRDEYSKYVLAIEILKKGNIWAVREAFELIFKEFGLPKMIRSDNGPPFASHWAVLGLTRLAVWWMALGIKLDRIDPASPYQNGGHERMHLDMKKELEGKIEGSLKMHQSVFDVWRNEFNKERPHESLGMKTPSAVYIKSERKYTGPIDFIEYPGGYITRQINNRGILKYKGHSVFISNVFHGYNIGLKQNSKKNLDVWFDDNHLGEIDLQTYLFKSILEI